uniref:Uncharacterized protein n=1 Tax=Panstrongylus lignarius TaxID=156445 RepID=A0A224XSU6_9HEMI
MRLSFALHMNMLYVSFMVDVCVNACSLSLLAPFLIIFCSNKIPVQSFCLNSISPFVHVLCNSYSFPVTSYYLLDYVRCL